MFVVVVEDQCIAEEEEGLVGEGNERVAVERN